MKSLANQQEPIQNMEYNVEMDPQCKVLMIVTSFRSLSVCYVENNHRDPPSY